MAQRSQAPADRGDGNRGWRQSDLEPWATMNADPQVREHLGELLTREQSDATVAQMQAEFDERGFGRWALAARESGKFIGRIGLDDLRPRCGRHSPRLGVGCAGRRPASPSLPHGSLRGVEPSLFSLVADRQADAVDARSSLSVPPTVRGPNHVP
ncbi:GNAT family N-acetyltransferase [Streptomyces sp. HUAS TT20]|nr:GNAT family N-acetyltransferase [Streptomyces sp. HUAS 15-9]UXY32876.1 GNAT family N-acetyltransferase [Streptomyces sp. HUAS 15-9]